MKKFFKKVALPLLAICALAGCSDKPDSPEVQEALKKTIKAEMILTGKELGQFPNGKSFVTLYGNIGGRVTATKVDNVKSKPNCAYFNILVEKHESLCVATGKKLEIYVP